MLYLSDEAISYAIAHSRTNSNYQTVIAVSDSFTKTYVQDIAIKLIKDYEDCKYKSNNREFRIDFGNGSVIHTLPGNPSSRGYKCHLLLVDDRIRDSIVQNVFSPMEILEWLDRSHNQISKENKLDIVDTNTHNDNNIDDETLKEMQNGLMTILYLTEPLQDTESCGMRAELLTIDEWSGYNK